MRYAFAFDQRFSPLLRVWGVTPKTAWAEISSGTLTVRWGFFRATTPIDNISSAQVTGPYKAHRAIGPRYSLTDRGATFGSTVAKGVCLAFKEPIPALLPLGLAKHPNLTLTLERPEEFVADLGVA